MGTNIIITKPNGDRVPMESRRTATSITAAKQTWELNAEDTISITVVSPFPQSYGIGDAITVFGRDYRLNRLPKVKKSGFAEYQYDLEFEGIQYDLLRVTYDVNINTTKNELQDIQGDSLTGDLKRFMDVLISNANRVFPDKWALGKCPETVGDKTLTFAENDNCLSVLQNLCSADNFGVEFDIVKVNGVYTINLYEKVGSVLPFTLEYGKGKGLYSINRDNVSSSNIITRLKVFGSTENITSKYRADRLCMYGKDKSSSYIEKAEAVAKYGIFEGRKNFDDIKPTFTGKITAIVDGDVLSFIDDTFPFDIKKTNADGETEYMIAGVSPKVHFNSGNLAGYEFEVHDYDHATHKFTLIKQTDDRGNVFPSETSPAFRFAKDDTYKVLDIAYSKEIEEAAENLLAEQGNKYYDENCQPKVQYSIEVTKSFVEKYFGGSDGVVNVFKPGDCLPIKDDEIGVDKAIRIKSFTRNVLDPYDYALTISDVSTKADIITRVISEIGDIDKVININNLKDPAQARANWRSSREVLNMVFDPETGGYYGDKITPASVDTIALSVGAKSMQFGLTNTVFQPNFNGNAQVVKWKGGVLTHYTIDPDTARSWALADGEITFTDNDPYYIYARCNRNGEDGVFEFSKTQHKCEESATVYYFLVGVLNSVDAETKVRSIALTYGFTMINGRFIKTGRIESSGNGESYFDIDSNEFALGDALIFNRNQSRKLLLNGVFVQSQGGTEFPLPCYRGEWQMNVAYFVGDTVRYAVDGKYSLYQCYKDCKDIVPTNSTYWAIQASAGSDGKGDKGDKGESPALVFRGDYSPSKVYYGTTSRLDCVKYGNAYYIARIDAGTFSNIEPTNTAKWNAFGSSFESVATGLLLAENANIANLIFRNQRLESNAKTNGIPNFFLDGLKNIASFAAGNVVFDGASATLGWLSVVGRELLGFDDDGIQRLRLTPNALPTVSSTSSSKDLVVKASGGDATFTGETDYEVSFEQAVHCYYGSEDTTDDIDMDFYGWVEFDIAEDNTLVDLSGIQFGCSVKRTGSSSYEYLSCSMSAYVQRKVGSSWENIGSVSLNGVNAKITIPKAGRIRISFNGSVSEFVDYDCSGTFTMATQSIQAVTAKTEMIIAKDGFMAIYNSNYMRMHSTDGLIVKFGNYYFRVNSSGIAKSTNGTSWTNL